MNDPQTTSPCNPPKKKRTILGCRNPSLDAALRDERLRKIGDFVLIGVVVMGSPLRVEGGGGFCGNNELKLTRRE